MNTTPRYIWDRRLADKLWKKRWLRSLSSNRRHRQHMRKRHHRAEQQLGPLLKKLRAPRSVGAPSPARPSFATRALSNLRRWCGKLGKH